MKIIRYVALLAICVGFSGMAEGSTIDFKMNVLDPPTYPGALIIHTLPFPISFTPCGAGELPGGLTASGCFAGVNDTSFSWSNLLFTFANNPALGSQPASCGNPGLIYSIFSSTSCTLTPDGSTYLLSFTNGVIIPGETFFVTEDGPAPEDFGTGLGTVVPEPSSLLLLSTGVMMLGLLIQNGRRRSVRAVSSRTM